jgi:hypothetical protein
VLFSTLKQANVSMRTKILPAKTISVFSKVVLGIEDSRTDDFLQLLFGDSPNTNWGVMSDTMYPLSQY